MVIAWNLSVGSNFKGTDNTTWGTYSMQDGQLVILRRLTSVFLQASN